MKLVTILILCVFALVLSSCNNQCLTVEGTYKEWAGGVTWCFDKSQSQEAGQPVVQNDEGARAVLVSESDTVLITEILAKNVQEASASVKGSSVSNFAEFSKFLHKVKEKRQ